MGTLKPSSNNEIAIGNLADDERKRYEAQIAMLKRKLIEQRLHFQKLLELPPDLERQLRKELGNEVFEKVYYQNQKIQKRN